MTDPATIIAALSEAQKRAILAAEPRRRSLDPEALFFTDTRGCGDLKALGLGFVTMAGFMLTPTAMDVRTKLQEEMQ